MTEVVTGEAVVLDVPLARFPSRLLARALDTVIQLLLLLILDGVVLAARVSGGLDGASAAAVGLAVSVLIIVGYPVIWETISRGATPGKYALGLRVTGDDGSPERFRQALVRGLLGVLEFWALFGFPALLCSLLSADSKRIGDFLAGTRVIQRRLPRQAASAATASAVPPWLAAWAASLELSSLSDDMAETVRQYLSRYLYLSPAARYELGTRLAASVYSQVSPPPPVGTPATDYLAAVLAERRRREQARLAAWHGVPAPAPGQPAPGPGTTGQAAAPGAGVPPGTAAAPGPAAAGPAPGAGTPAAPPGTPASTGGFTPPL